MHRLEDAILYACAKDSPCPRFPEMSCKTFQSSRKLPAVPEAEGFRVAPGNGCKRECTIPNWAEMIFPRRRGDAEKEGAA